MTVTKVFPVFAMGIFDRNSKISSIIENRNILLVAISADIAHQSLIIYSYFGSRRSTNSPSLYVSMIFVTINSIDQPLKK
jgi:hypothetical protein